MNTKFKGQSQTLYSKSHDRQKKKKSEFKGLTSKI